MASWLDDVITALKNLGGTAHYDLLYKEIQRIRKRPLPEAWKKIIQRVVQDHAIESSGFKTRRLFYSVNGKGSGVWSLVTDGASSVGESGETPTVSEPNLGSGQMTLPNKRNTAWTRDELLIALELYLRCRPNLPSKESAEIAELSEFLNALASGMGLVGASTFRNQNGVYMKLMNFRRFDPFFLSQGMVGLTRGNKDEEKVWKEYSNDLERLQRITDAIRSAVQSRGAWPAGWEEETFEAIEAEEGRILTRLHRVRERDRTIVEKFKKVALKKNGRLVCAACGFDYVEKYGTLGEGLIDVHHTKPVHTLAPGEKTRFSDLILLCANCHRLVHASRKWLTLEQIRQAVLVAGEKAIMQSS